MIYLILTSALSLLILAVLAWRAPRGWQDDEGFHYGEEPQAPPARSPRASRSRKGATVPRHAVVKDPVPAE